MAAWSCSLHGLLSGDPLSEHTLYRHISDSLYRWGLGFFIAASLGTAYGLMAGCWRVFEGLTSPTVQMLQVVPGLAWIPVADPALRIGDVATIFMIAVTAFTPVAISATTGVKQVDTAYLRAARMLGARRSTLLTRVLLPGPCPIC